MTKTSMKYPKRYSPHYTLRNGDTGLASFGVEAKDDGIYVEHAECWKLYEEVIRLKAEVERLTNNCDHLDQKLDEEIDKSAMLCGQVERLTKAGDDMAVWITIIGNSSTCWQIEEWLRAKKGLLSEKEQREKQIKAAKDGIDAQ